MGLGFRIFNPLLHRPIKYSFCNNFIFERGVRFVQTTHINWMKSKAPSSLLYLRLPTHCSCFVSSCNVPVSSASVLSRCYRYVSTPSGVQPPGNEEPEKKPSLYQRFKTMYRDYWYVLLPVHLVTSAAWFGGFYYMASSGVDIVQLLEQLNVSEKVINPLRNGHATTGYLAIAYALYKIATPLRYTVTLGGTTISINYLRKWGYIKPMPSKAKLKEMYVDKKEILKEKGQTIKQNVMQSLKPTQSKKDP